MYISPKNRNFAAQLALTWAARLKIKVKKINRILLILIACAGTAYATTPAKGVFSVAAGKTIRFATSPETDLVQWATANAWREDQKNADGHNGWYVLNHDEWTYLLVTRDINKNNLGTVNGKKGMIILPDEWVQPALVPAFKPVSEQAMRSINWDILMIFACSAVLGIAIQKAAEKLGYEPYPFLIALMIAVSSSFATPIGSPTHMLVYGPGGYRFSDFLKIGLIMNLIILAANILIVNLVYPLTPLQ